MAELSRISDVIARDLRLRIDGGQPLPCALTIAALADNYQVSQSPVRTAVEQLVADKFLCKLGNGRLEVNPKKLGRQRGVAQEPAELVSPADLQRQRDLTFDQIVESVLRRSLSGRVDFLREEATAEKFQVGRAYVRQVCSELSGRGLLEHIPRRGWKVRPFDLNDMNQFLDIREVLECKALMLAKDRLDPERLQSMLDGNPQPPDSLDNKRNLSPNLSPKYSADQWDNTGLVERFAELELNNEIHGYLIQMADNRYIADFFQRNGLYFFKLFDMAAFDLKARIEMTAQHRQILQALLDQRWEDAKIALAQHIRSQQPLVGEMLERFKERGDEAELD